ncbi:hypothetical protein CDAR_252051, partial [Caerostris darwini]
ATHTIETHVRKRNVRLSIFIGRNVFPNGAGRAPKSVGVENNRLQKKTILPPSSVCYLRKGPLGATLGP